MAKEKALGKGLGALLDDEGISQEDAIDIATIGPKTKKISLPKGITQENGELYVDISLLKPNPFQPRTEFDDDALSELADNIKDKGVLEPLVIEDAGDGTFFIIMGERRCRASKLAGLKKVPIRLKKFTDEEKLEVALIENIQRENLNPIEEAVAYKRLMDLSKINQEEVAKRVGKNRSTVANAIRLLKLPEDMQGALAQGDISAGHARAILSVINPSDQRILFGRILGTGLSVRETEQYAQELNGGSRVVDSKKTDKVKSGDNGKNKDPDIAALEQQFLEALGTKVALKGDVNKGTIQIDYYSREDLDRLYEIFTK